MAALAAAPTARAYRIAGDPWPGRIITFSNSLSRYDAAVHRATVAWNRAGVGIRFKRVPRSRAKVVFGWLRPAPSSGCGGGVFGAGYPGRQDLPKVVYVARPCPYEGVRGLTVAHELGHVLGLGHESRVCALMNPVHTRGGGTHCSQTRSAVRNRYKRLLELDDIAGARALYDGGAAARPRAPKERAGPAPFIR